MGAHRAAAAPAAAAAAAAAADGSEAGFGRGVVPTALGVTCQAPTGDARRVYDLLSEQQEAAGVVKLHCGVFSFCFGLRTWWLQYLRLPVKLLCGTMVHVCDNSRDC